MKGQICSEAGCRKPASSYSSRCKAHNRARDMAVAVALDDEFTRFNRALASGKVAVLKTAFGPYVVQGARRSDFWYVTFPQGEQPTRWNQRSFAGCNDSSWHDLMAQVGEPRNPLFAKEPSK